MASRPFAGVNLDLDSSSASALLGYKSTTDEPGQGDTLVMQSRQLPCPVALEPLSRARAAVMTVLIKLPGSPTPPGQSGLALGSCLISLTSNMEEDLRKGFIQETSLSQNNLANKMAEQQPQPHPTVPTSDQHQHHHHHASPTLANNGHGGGGGEPAAVMNGNGHRSGQEMMIISREPSCTPPPSHPPPLPPGGSNPGGDGRQGVDV